MSPGPISFYTTGGTLSQNAPSYVERQADRDLLHGLQAADATHHDHLIDVETGNVIEFVDEELEALQRRIAEKLGFRLVDHRMELYGVAVGRKG